MPKINAKIDRDGNISFEVNGVSGSSCEDLTSQLIQAIGEVEEKHYTEEYEQELPDRIDVYEED